MGIMHELEIYLTRLTKTLETLLSLKKDKDIFHKLALVKNLHESLLEALAGKKLSPKEYGK